MPSASQLASRPVSPQSATPHRFVRQRIDKIIFATALIASATAFIAPLATAQDLGEIARQERAKKQSNPAPPSTHVYTNDDVKREEILTPDDKTRFSAITQPSTTKPAQSATPLASESTPPPGPIPSAVHSEAPAVAKAVAKPAPVPPPSPTVPKVTAAVPVQTPQPVSATTDVAAAQPVAQISVAPIIVAQTIDAPTLATVPLDQMPLGDVARYHRAKNHLYARANSQIDPDPVNAPSAPALATTIPVTISFAQLPLGDVARYYRAKKREEDAAIADRAPTTSAMSVSPCTLPTASS